MNRRSPSRWERARDAAAGAQPPPLPPAVFRHDLRGWDMPLALAFVAGGLATVNPCGFSLLPALLSFYLTGNGRDAGNRMIDALHAGGAVGAGMMGTFLVVGIPITLGASQVVRAVPWAGAVTGLALTMAGIAALAGWQLRLPLRLSVRAPQERNGRRMLVFGIAYGTASLGCTLPIFLSVIGASLASRGAGGALLVMGTYALGMFVVVMALSLTAVAARQGLARRIKTLVPRMHRIGAVFLLLAGIYLTYYWTRVLSASAVTLAQDPVVRFVQQAVAMIERAAATSGTWIVATAALIVVAAAGVAASRARRDRRRRRSYRAHLPQPMCGAIPIRQDDDAAARR